MTATEQQIDTSKFLVYIYKKDGVIEIFYNNKLVHTTPLYDEEDAWYGFACKVNGRTENFDLNLYEGLAGLYICDKVGKNTYRTGAFLDRVLTKEL